MQKIYIKLEDVCVSYNTNVATIDKLVAHLKKKSIIREINSLKNVNLDLIAGDRLALIGQNGAGKTTLLKTLAGIYHPKSGSLTSQGRISTLLDLSMGFIPHNTGLMNISRKLLFMGLSKQEIKDSIPGIVAFSELGEHLFEWYEDEVGICYCHLYRP